MLAKIGIEACQTQIEKVFQLDGLVKIYGKEFMRREEAGEVTFQPGEYMSWTRSTTKFDYMAWYPGLDVPLVVDCKDKKLFRPENWNIPKEEVHDWVVFDETAVQKLLNGGYNHFFVVHDYSVKRLLLWTSQHIGLGYRSWHVRLTTADSRKMKVLFPVDSAWFQTIEWKSIIDGMKQWINCLAEDSANQIETTLHDKRFYKLGVLYQNRDANFYAQDLGGQGGLE